MFGRFHDHITNRRIGGLFVVASVAMLGGCVSSPGRVQYTALVTHEVQPSRAANDDIAIAFGLDGFGEQPGVLAANERVGTATSPGREE